MTTICKNCHDHFEGNYCSHCGQSSNTHKINIHFVWHDIQHGLLHFDKGILFTIKELFARPGFTIREFIEGKRVNHYKPLSLVLVLAGVLAILSHHFKVDMDFLVKVTSTTTGGAAPTSKTGFLEVKDWLDNNFTLVTLLFLPLNGVASFLAFKKYGYNYTEHLVFNAFLTSQKLIIYIVLLPLVVLFKDTHFLIFITSGRNLVVFGMALWTFIQFFTNRSKFKTFLLTLLTYLFIIIQLFILILITIQVIKFTN